MEKISPWGKEKQTSIISEKKEKTIQTRKYGRKGWWKSLLLIFVFSVNLRDTLQWESKKLEYVSSRGTWKIALTREKQQERAQGWTGIEGGDHEVTLFPNCLSCSNTWLCGHTHGDGRRLDLPGVWICQELIWWLHYIKKLYD